MSTIPPRFMHELRDRLTLSEVIARRVKLTRAGREFKACCPFHHEKSPSFYVNDDKQFFHCFGCGAHGDVIGFVMRNDNLSFIEAIETLAQQAGMEVPQQTPQEIAQARTEKDLYSLLDDTTRWFEGQLRQPAGADGLRYMKERGMPEEMLSSFRIGFAPADGHALPRYLKEKGYTDAQMIEAGVARRSESRKDVYSFFRDRVIFPVPDRRGRTVAFGGRVLPEHLRPLKPGDSKPPKYINSSETGLFHKGRMVYGEPHARQAANDGLPLIVVEGYLDVMASFGAGYRGAVAPLGTALTEDQIMALWKMIPGDPKIPILCFDGDEAGRRAAIRACARIMPLLKADHSVRLAFLPDGHDPDSLIRAQGKAAFDIVIESAISLVDFLWMHYTSGRNFDTPEERAGLTQTLDNEALRIPDRDVQHHYREAFRQKVREAFTPKPQPRNSARPERTWTGKGGRGAIPPVPAVQIRRPAFAEDRMALLILLACILNHPGLFGWVEEELGQLDLPEDRLTALKGAVIEALSGNPDLDSAGLQDHLMGEGFEKELKNILSDGTYTHAGFARPQTELEFVRKGWQDTMSFMRRKSVWKELKAAGKALASEFSDENEQRILALHRSDRTGEGQG